MNSLLDKVALASSLDVSVDDLDALGHIKEYRSPVFGPYFESAAVIQSLNSTHKCNAHPCMHFVRRLPAQALARA